MKTFKDIKEARTWCLSHADYECTVTMGRYILNWLPEHEAFSRPFQVK